MMGRQHGYVARCAAFAVVLAALVMSVPQARAQDHGVVPAAGLLGLRGQTYFLAADVVAAHYARADLCGWPTRDAEVGFERELLDVTRDPVFLSRVRDYVVQRRQALRPILAERFGGVFACARGDHQRWRWAMVDLTARLVETE
jgi:hypothetical protein